MRVQVRAAIPPVFGVENVDEVVVRGNRKELSVWRELDDGYLLGSASAREHSRGAEEIEHKRLQPWSGGGGGGEQRKLYYLEGCP